MKMVKLKVISISIFIEIQAFFSDILNDTSQCSWKQIASSIKKKKLDE